MPDTPFASSRNWRGPLLNADGQPDELPDNDSDHDELASKLALKVSEMLDRAARGESLEQVLKEASPEERMAFMVVLQRTPGVKSMFQTPTIEEDEPIREAQPLRGSGLKGSFDASELANDTTTQSKRMAIREMPEQDPARAWLEHLWDLADGKRTQEDMDARDALLDFLVAHDPAERLEFMPPAPGSDLAAAGLTGAIEQVSLQMRLEVSKAQAQPGGARAYLKEVLPPTVARLLRQGSDPEKVVDLVLAGVLPLRTRVTPALIDLGRHLHYLLRQKNPEGSGYYASWAAIGDLVGGDEEPGLIRDAVLYYEGALRDMAERYERLEGEFRGVLEGAANNLCGTLSRLTEQKESPDSERVMNRLHRLAGMAAMLRGGGRRDGSLPEDTQCLRMWEALGIGSSPQLGTRHAKLLATMMHMPSSWRSVGREATTAAGKSLPQHVCMALVEAAAAPARILVGADDDEVSQTLFNSGVSLLRVERNDQGGSKNGTVIARIAMNAAGLCWGLRGVTTNNGLLQAINERHGLSCAVNMFGALVDARGSSPQVFESARSSIESLARDLIALEPVLGPSRMRNATDFFRLSQSVKQLGVSMDHLPALEKDPAKALRLHLLETLNALAPDTKDYFHGIALKDKGDVVSLSVLAANFVRHFLQPIAGNDVFQDILAWFANLLLSIGQEAEDLRGGVQKVFQEIEPSSLVSARILTEIQWRQLRNEVYAPPSVPMDKFLYDLDWSFIG